MALTDLNSTLKNVALNLSQLISSVLKLGTTLGATITGIRANITALQAAVAALTPPALVYLGTVTVSAGQITDTTIIAANNSKYRSFQFVIKNIVNTVVNIALEWQWHSGGAFQATSYVSTATITKNGGAPFGDGNNSDILLGYSDTADPGLSGVLLVSNLASTTVHKMMTGTTGSSDGGTNAYVFNVAGWWTGGTGAIDGFQIIAASGTITSGSVDIYGVL
jgi:hypothetical protein